MPKFRTIKALVLDHVHRKKGVVNYGELSEGVLANFPDSAWKRTHWAWYRYQILRGRFRDQFTDEERRNLEANKRSDGRASNKSSSRRPSRPVGTRRGPAPRDPEVKEVGDIVLGVARDAIAEAARADEEFYFKINRWVYSRLLQDEIRVKRPIKRQLWDGGMKNCQACGETFKSLKGVEIHRKDGSLGYSAENCELLCRDCHQEL